jgi:predicted aspartyl protease
MCYNIDITKGDKMKSVNKYWWKKTLLITLSVVLICAINVQGGQSDWQREEVNWHISGKSRIKAVRYPTDKPLSTFSQRNFSKPVVIEKRKIAAESVSAMSKESLPTLTPEITYVIDSPPIDGFVPWIVVSLTDKRLMDLELDAVIENSVVGRYPPGTDSQTDYVIGIFDTGASAHVIGYTDATRAGLFNNFSRFITSNTSIISGVTGSVEAWVSQPLAVFIDGLGAIDEQGLLSDTSGMVGESNVAIMVGQNPGSEPDLPTVIGSPLSVFFTTVINNDRQITVQQDNQEFTSPHISIYEHDDPQIPSYQNVVPLELRPAGAVSVQYIPSLEGFFEFPPASPSVIIGNLTQSLFFIHSVDLTEGTQKAIDKDRFMLDTGAQVSVIGSRIAARLALDPSKPDFEVEIQDVTGEVEIIPGFYLDSLEIPALGEWLSYTNVPVILLDVSSPEGGTLDGIIGMNLFVNFNLVLRGGGLFLEDDPVLEFEVISSIVSADIAPIPGDGVVDYQDLSVLADTWLSSSDTTTWDPQADIAPPLRPDGVIDFLDYAVLAEHWLEIITP